MARRTVLDRVEQLERRGDRLAGPLAQRAHPVHVKAADVLAKMLTLGGQLAGENTPAHMRVIMRMLETSRPMLLEQLVTIEPAQIRAFMGALAGELLAIANEPDPGAAPALDLDASMGQPDPAAPAP